MTKTTHHKLILWLPLLFMAFYTSVQISKIYTTAQTDYNSMSIGVSATHSTSPDKAKDNGVKPNIGLPQDVDKTATTHTAINENTQITITDKANQTQDTTNISTDTDNASFTMTQINTEVLDIRADISQQVSKDGFKAVGDLAMELAANGDKSWEDGGISKTLAHAAMGAVVAGIGNGDAIGGALGAGAAEMARPATEGESDATQQWVSTLVGAVAGGGTGASTGLDGEKFNRQLHQNEIAFLKDKENIELFMQYYQGETGIALSEADAQKLLAQGGISLVDESYNNALGANDNSAIQSAQEFIKYNYEGKSSTFGMGTDNFQTTEQTYKDRYENLEHFVENKDFYKENLNLNTGKTGTASDYVNGALQPFKDLATALEQDTLGTLEAMGEGIVDSVLNPIDTLGQAGADARTLEEQAQLDAMMGDDQSAAEHRGEAYGGAVANILSRGVAGTVGIKIITRLDDGKVRVELEGGKTVDVPEGAIGRDSSGNIFIKESYTAPSGRTYDFYGQKIDLDLNLPKDKINPATKKPYTNREWMKRGNNPYILDNNGKPVSTNQHHSQQRADGPIFEIKTTTHQNPINQQALHPYGNSKNPSNPVDHTKEWNKDRININKERVRTLELEENK